MRYDGYYWVKLRGEFMPAYWYGRYGHWSLRDGESQEEFQDADLDWIGEWIDDM